MPSIPEPIAVEARAKIIWGESVEKVRAFLQAKNVGAEDAAVLIEEIMSERAELIRDDGKKKLWIGVAFVAAPIVFYFVSQAMGFMMLKVLAGLIVLGAVGVAKLMKGLSMVLSPRSITGDLSNASQ